ncbi:MAG: ABC transporter substrate-binding protein [Clostridiales bacterium]|nr:ABC transporter substrate-binding protein [Clostridiales bacterium]OPZ68089.1 MAG: Oligopeptide-binding protein AppA precursor [Firmicutes bacterium ADurb.Bin467]
MYGLKRLFSALLAVCLLLGVAAAEVAREGGALVVGYAEFSGAFSPFFGESAYDMDVAERMTGESLLVTDRVGGVILNGIEGETVPYNGVDYAYRGIADLSVDYDESTDRTAYTARLKPGVRFSDGEEMNADDVIFTYYVLLDPAYSGVNTLGSYDIVGLKAYQTQVPDEIYGGLAATAEAIYAAGPEHVWSGADNWTEEEQDAFWAEIDAAWLEDVAEIVGFVDAAIANDEYLNAFLGMDTAAYLADGTLKVPFAMAAWGYAEVVEGVLTSAVTGSSWKLSEGERPSVEDFYKELYAAYGGDPEAFFGKEAVDNTALSTLATAEKAFIQKRAEGASEGGVPNIAGIRKIDDYAVEVVLKGYSAPAIYKVFGITVAPLHYYGDPSQYDYENNRFGHPFGDLSLVAEKTGAPLGAGPYRFVGYRDKVVRFEANEYFWKGEPKIKHVQFKETSEADRIGGVATGALDITDPQLSVDAVEAIRSANGGELTGPVIRTETADFLGYGYIGVNASLVKVGDDPGSEASRNLRRAILTVMAAYRAVAIDSYYGEAAQVLEYPISNTSWAAPQRTDEGYRAAYSIAVDGSDIYSPDMDAEQRYAAALAAAAEYLKAAGYTFDEAAGKFTAAPEGASLSYELCVGAEGVGDYPSFGVLTEASNAFAKIGLTLSISDTNWSALMSRMVGGTAPIWAAAWGAEPDPDSDMYAKYVSTNALGAGGGDSNLYMVSDPELDKWILDARASADRAYRKAVYAECLDKIVDWAVELPVYQRQECFIFSAERLNLDTLTPEITTFWKWIDEIETLEMM